VEVFLSSVVIVGQKKEINLLHKIYKSFVFNQIMEEIVKIPREEYEKLKLQANIDVELLKQLMESFKDIKEGRIERVR